MNISTAHIIHLILGSFIPFQAFLFSVILFVLSRQNDKPKQILAIYMLLVALFHFFIFLENLNLFISNTYYIAIPLLLFMPFLAYFYIQAFYRKKHLWPEQLSKLIKLTSPTELIFLVTFSILSLLEISTYIYSWTEFWPIQLILILLMAFVGVFAVTQKQAPIMEIEKEEETENNEIQEESVIPEVSTAKPKYERSSLNDVAKKKLVQKLEKYLKFDKPFLNNHLKLDDIAKHLKTNRQYLSQVINETYHQNFYALINDYRIKESKKMFFDKKHKKLSIMGVANSVGFNSKSTFNTLFKKSTGLTPSQFIRKNKL